MTAVSIALSWSILLVAVAYFWPMFRRPGLTAAALIIVPASRSRGVRSQGFQP